MKQNNIDPKGNKCPKNGNYISVYNQIINTFKNKGLFIGSFY